MKSIEELWKRNSTSYAALMFLGLVIVQQALAQKGLPIQLKNDDLIERASTARHWINLRSSMTSQEMAAKREVSCRIDQLRSLVSMKIMNRDVADGLVGDLKKTTESLDRENLNATVDLLRGFIRRVKALYVVGMLSPEEGQPLIHAASNLIKELHS